MRQNQFQSFADVSSKEETGFGIDLAPEKPRWKQLLSLALAGVFGWGALHVGMNASAYTEIAQFRVNNAVVAVKEVHKRVTKKEQQNAYTLNASVLTANAMSHTQPENTADQVVESLDLPELEDDRLDVFSAIDVYPSDDRIVIPRLGKNIPLLDVGQSDDFDLLEENMQEALRGGVAVHPVSREPDRNGNFFITGHSSYFPWDEGRFKDVFALLHEMVEGDEVWIYRHGRKYEYVIEAQTVVKPEQVEVLSQPNDRKMLTLMTCTPIGTAKERLVLTAVPKDQVRKSRVRAVRPTAQERAE